MSTTAEPQTAPAFSLELSDDQRDIRDWVHGFAESVVPMIAIPIPASPQNSSSLTIGIVRPVSSAQNCAIASKP